MCLLAVGLHEAGLSGRVRVCVRPVSSVHVSVCWLSPAGVCRACLLWRREVGECVCVVCATGCMWLTHMHLLFWSAYGQPIRAWCVCVFVSVRSTACLCEVCVCVSSVAGVCVYVCVWLVCTSM